MKVLLFKYINNKCSAEEVNQLLDFFNIKENEEALHQAVQDYLEKEEGELVKVPEERLNTLLEKLKTTIHTATESPVAKIRFIKSPWFRVAAAASVLLLLASDYLIFNWQEKEADVKNIAQQPVEKKNELLPGGDKAMLTLADGSVIVLDTAVGGELANQGNISVQKLKNGLLAYKTNTSTKNSEAAAINTITTPKGGQYQVVLSDGSMAWLNAGSSIKFPAAFTAGKREVAITGEVYFEVAKNVHSPFTVSVNNMQVSVLGTHFNINSYSDEDAVKTTLLEGSVKMITPKTSVLLKPGQQASITENKNEFIGISNADIEKVMAWKNGLFYFEKACIDEVMRQLSRWYNAEVVYDGSKPAGRFTGTISRNTPLSKVLYMLQLNDVKIKTESGNKIIIQSK